MTPETTHSNQYSNKILVARTHCGCGEREGCSGRAVSEPGIPSSAGEVSPTWTLLESNYNSSTQRDQISFSAANATL